MPTESHCRRLLTLELRWLGGLTLSALVFVVLPFPWLNGASQWLGTGALPATPAVCYLVRSLSALYALVGALALFLATDVVRYLPVIRFLVLSCVGFGILLVGVDLAAHMPWWWTASEGPLIAPWGVHLWLVARRVGQTDWVPHDSTGDDGS